MNDDAKKVLELLKQEDMIKDGLANGSGPWTVVYDSWSNDDGNIDGCWYAVFAQPDQREEILSKSEWDFKIGDACPGFSQESQKSEIVYSRRKKNQYLSQSLSCRNLMRLCQISVLCQKNFVF